MAGPASLRTAGIRRGVHRLAVPVRRAAELADPSLRLARRRLLPVPACAVVCIYRRRHVAGLARWIAGLPTGWQVALWALEDTAPELASWTVGAGSGSRLVLLNRLIATLVPIQATLVIMDDDIAFVRGDVVDAVGLARLAGLDLAQPAHAAHSAMSYPFVRTRPGVAVRRTTYVEQGPCLLLSAKAQAALLPLPADMGMGWGIEAGWSRRAASGALALGIVDAVTIRHLAPPGGAYDAQAQMVQALGYFAAAGFDSLAAAHVTTAALRPWHLPRNDA